MSNRLIQAVGLSLAVTATTALQTASAEAVSPAQITALAEESFLYGLPIVMNYAVMYEYSVPEFIE